MSSWPNPSALDAKTQAFPTLTAGQIARLVPVGKSRQVKPGDILFQPGDSSSQVAISILPVGSCLRQSGRSHAHPRCWRAVCPPYLPLVTFVQETSNVWPPPWVKGQFPFTLCIVLSRSFRTALPNTESLPITELASSTWHSVPLARNPSSPGATCSWGMAIRLALSMRLSIRQRNRWAENQT